MKLKDKNIRKITRTGRSSLAITLPLEMARDLNWREKQRVKISRVKGGLLIRDYRD